MKIKILAILLMSMVLVSCQEDFLERPPLDRLTDETYWTNESNVRTFAWGFYPQYFSGYGSGFTWGRFFSGQSLNDDFAPSSPTQFRLQPVTAATASYWRFTWVRKANLFLNRIKTVPMSEEAINHWSGVARFFRAIEYAQIVQQFGDAPWFEEEVDDANLEMLYRPRDPRGFVMDKVLEDFEYASRMVRQSDGTPKQTVNRDVVLAYMSQMMLFEASWQKYHLGDDQKAAKYFEAAKSAANQLIQSGRYSLGNYRQVFTSVNLASNPEVIIFRHYEAGLLTHALMSYNNNEPQTGVSKNALDAYLASDGLPIGISPLYQGDRTREAMFANRDSRIQETFVTSQFRLNGISPNFSTSGVATHKYLNESLRTLPEGSSNLNIIDSPVMRYGEVLVNYLEAAAELASLGGAPLTQADLDKSINVLRARPGVNLPSVTLVGDRFAVNGVAYDDPARDQSVSSILWEVRRERRVELMMEGFRLNDLRRWAKLEYADTQANPSINRGAWVTRAEFPNLQSSVVLSEGSEGYIIPATVAAAQRVFNNPRVYLDPIPIDQIALYEENGVTLTQNEGW
ncbi:RagB/SusD family nutrient uptake outer membrane protein [Belliella kenyensis]|uniref:RagB/SusD family nutrient uptake outer membrane protein n=1 Tax=Belliella kenyensis TaxID=1472724 RepID=A0ABV8EKC9_9BACT|nr:RagB/SusD family nutrient uptake outer membrane protein [Belliella kenyensis]MCH7401326.1 RagB/SusD family nutrient uptake outer membrane protein [Belliella kenyensis]MDN3602770.1 RagB/SusD family nutrient uptake outer membrane protein [Belliella kenyensis]